MFYLGLMWEYFKNYAKSRMTYRADFWIEVVSDLTYQAMNLAVILIAFRHTPALGGWSEAEIVFVFGFFMVPYGIFSCFFDLWNFGERYIVKGEMDRVLTRPAHNLFQVMLENMYPPGLIGSFVGIAIMAVTARQMEMAFGWTDLVMLAVLTAGAVLVYFGLYTAITAIAFFTDAPTGILPLMYNLQSYGRYPVTIYNRTMRFVLTWLLPFAFVGVYPASFFLERSGPGDLRMALLTPVVGMVFTAIGLTVWNIGVKRYRGAGS
ncbi:MAG: ABC transporter permease [Thermobacillus sp. ZCTH02-B1]|uniref:ABC transporter permease n=1 Tax=Thermobacillus sp. ZCTH02-B1 TaxID=1858795 RepID=UPI000B57AE87|nr:ABC-2 family transporter protein [Thermobacillus sp. ZCTH02-B1]OUM95735.1 MAG: ABC transporter permease [Thermobacillus sp. ZCTH02-B1]